MLGTSLRRIQFFLKIGPSAFEGKQMLPKIVRNMVSFFWLNAKSHIRGNVYLGNNVEIDRATKLTTDDNSRIIVEDEVYVGSGCRIRATKGSKIVFRRKSRVFPGTEIYAREPDVEKSGDFELGENALLHKNNRIDITGNVFIGDHVMTGEGCVIYTHDHRYDKPGLIWKQGIEIEDVRIERGSWIGTNVQIMPGVTIGEGAIIAAGAIVTGNIERYVVAGGVPAKAIKKRFEDSNGPFPRL